MPDADAPPLSWRTGLWNLPNALTLSRILLVPVFIVLLVSGGVWQRWAALGVFVVASVTDHLDGRLARSRGLVTPFGTLADPVADKALTLGAFAVLSATGEIPWWITIAIAVRELGITALRAVLARRAIIPASMGGKIKTTIQIAAIVAYLVPWASFLAGIPLQLAHGLAQGLLWLALAATLVTGADYVRRAWRLRKAAPAPTVVP